MFLLFIFLILFHGQALAQEERRGLVDMNTGKLTNVGRGIDHSGMVDEDHMPIRIPWTFNNVPARLLIYSEGRIRAKTNEEIRDEAIAARKREIKRTLIERKRNLEAMKGLQAGGGISYGQEIAKVSQEISDLKAEFNS